MEISDLRLLAKQYANNEINYQDYSYLRAKLIDDTVENESNSSKLFVNKNKKANKISSSAYLEKKYLNFYIFIALFFILMVFGIFLYSQTQEKKSSKKIINETFKTQKFIKICRDKNNYNYFYNNKSKHFKAFKTTLKTTKFKKERIYFKKINDKNILDILNNNYVLESTITLECLIKYRSLVEI